MEKAKSTQRPEKFGEFELVTNYVDGSLEVQSNSYYYSRRELKALVKWLLKVDEYMEYNAKSKKSKRA
jgi:hypothetical protein